MKMIGVEERGEAGEQLFSVLIEPWHSPKTWYFCTRMLLSNAYEHIS